MDLNGGMNRIGLFGVVLAASCLSIAAGDWPQWRGPERNGHAGKGAEALKELPEQCRLVF